MRRLTDLKLAGRCCRAIAVSALLFSMTVATPFNGSQGRGRKIPRNPKEDAPIGKPIDLVERAIATICRERLRDPIGSVPIDEMAIQPPLPLTDSRVVAARSRAQALLPVARRLVPFALTKIAASHNLEPLSLRWIVERVQAVSLIKAEVDEHDNAVWRPSEPDTIIFGTVFLAGLRSDEAVLAVLAHELTHAVDGTDRALQPVFMRIAGKESLGRSIGMLAAGELVCELVGIEVLRDHIGQTSKRGNIRQRLSRVLQKDCVRQDLADEHHLSPRDTMRMLLTLQPKLASTLATEDRGKKQKKPKRQTVLPGRKKVRR